MIKIRFTFLLLILEVATRLFAQVYTDVTIPADTKTETNDFVSVKDVVEVNATDKIQSVTVADGNVIVTTADGKIVLQPAKDKIVAITAPSGQQYVVDGKTNTVYTQGTPNGEAPKTSKLASSTAENIKYTTTFSALANQAYGFDTPGENSPAGNYNQKSIAGKSISIPWKSIENGCLDKLGATIEGKPADSVFFARESASMVMVAKGTNEGDRQLMITGQGDSDEDGLFAYYRTYTGDSIKKVETTLSGMVNMITYEKKEISLCIVAVNGSILPNADYVQTEINKIYSPAIVKWYVTSLAGGLTVTLPHTNQTTLDNTDADDKMNYTSDMKLVNSAMKDNAAYNSNTIYLFFFDEATNNAVNGYMPFNRQFGYIFKYKQNPDEYTHTIAHELGHGAFRLRHTFDEQYGIAKGSTQNLMDYTGGTELRKFQWDAIHDAGLNLGNFESEVDTDTAKHTEVLVTEEDKPVALIDRDFLYFTVEGRTDTLFNGHTLHLTSQDSTVKLTVGYKNKELYTKAYGMLNLKKIKKVHLPGPTHWADSIKTNLTQWNHTTGNTIGKEYSLNLRTVGSSKLKLDASNALNVIFTYEYDTVAHARKDTLIRGNRVKENKIEVNISITEPGTLLFKPKDDNYYLDYGFDDAHFTQCQQSNDYEKLTIGNTDYYVPWLGVLPNTEVEIKLEYQSKDITQDSLIILECAKTNLVFTENNSNYLSVNSFATKQLTIKTKSADVYYINAYSLNKQKVKTRIGKLKVESKDYGANKAVRIIRFKRSDETSYPVVNKQLLVNELNNQGYKQAFLKFELDNSSYTDTLTITKSSNDSVKLAWLAPKVQNLTTTSGIYYVFIVSKGKNQNDGEGYLGGTKKIIILLGTTHYVVATHELGHNFGLQHTWEKKGDGGQNVLNHGSRTLTPQFSTKNIMDYIYSSDPEHRRYFFLFQINHLKNQ